MNNEPKMVRVRVLVGIDEKGNWAAYSYSEMDKENAQVTIYEMLPDSEPVAWRWLVADVSLPEEPEVAATVEA